MVKSIKELEQTLTGLLGKKTCICIETPGTGEERKVKFYSLKFEDDTSVYICSSKVYYREKLLQLICDFEYYHKHKSELEE